ncbi:MAG: formylmethanofuran dehydrogenase [Deltaproteobacteria bacterium]|nr:formylmethanofuran dehydrogenase [Deltaproteobacteria bacterium]
MSMDRETLTKAFEFHGHICWASAAGVRAGLVALRILGAKRAGSSGVLHCILEIGENHGAQCFADGVQYATGCTIGKGNIEKAGWGKLAFTLIDKKKEQSIRVSYKSGAHHQKVAESSFMRKRGQGIPPTEIPEAEAWEMVDIILNTPENEVLSIGDVQPYEWEEYGEILGLMPCHQCGELVSKVYLRVVGKNHMCIPCSGYER